MRLTSKGLLALAAASSLTPVAFAAIKENNTLNLINTGSWVGGIAPTNVDYATWNSVVDASNTTVATGGNLTYGGIQILDPAGPIVINNHTSGGNPVASTVTLAFPAASGAIIEMANATQDLTFNASFLRLGPSGATTHAINIAAGRTFTLNGSMTVQGGTHTLNFAGPGAFVANGAINHSNQGLAFTQSGGTLTLNAANSFGGSSGFFVLSGGTLIVGNNDALNGTRLDFGTATLRSNNSSVVLTPSARLIGNLTVDGTESLGLGGSLNQTNGSRVLTNNLADGAALTLNNISLANSDNSRTLTIGGTGTTIINGIISNGGATAASGLTKTGAGTLVLNNTGNSYLGTTTVSAGTLAGVGRVPALLNMTGGTLAPGKAASPVGVLTTGNLNLGANATFSPDLASAASADALSVEGTVTLAGLLAPVLAFQPVGGQALFVLQNDGTEPISGSFSNAAEGSTLNLSFNGTPYDFTLSYLGDFATGSTTGGNDVVLTAVAIPEPAGLALALPALALLRRRR